MDAEGAKLPTRGPRMKVRTNAKLLQGADMIDMEKKCLPIRDQERLQTLWSTEFPVTGGSQDDPRGSSSRTVERVPNPAGAP